MSRMYHGAQARYVDPEGVEFVVLVLRPDRERFEVRGAAHGLACVGWQVALAHDGTAYAASSGTPQRTYTPEKPPVMEQTAVPGTTDRARTLLSFSPALTPELIAEREGSCSR